MGKNILILNGSPRKTGNTAGLTKAFAEGAESAGHKVTEFFLDSMNIHGCKGCWAGDSSKDCPCVQQDDMNQIYPVAKACDIVVLASPLYYWNMSGQLRTAVDRLFALEEGDDFEDVALYYDHLTKHLKWNNLGKVLCGGVAQPGDIKDRPELEEAKKLGASL